MEEVSKVHYKVYREPERRVFAIGYKGATTIDAAHFFCPYRPGMSDEEIAAVHEYHRVTQPTQFQIDLLKSIQDRPMIAVYKPRS